MTVALTTAPTVTMTSREIAALTGKHHFHVTTDILKMLEELMEDVTAFRVIYFDSMNREQYEYALNRELTDVLLTGYSANLRRRVIARWRELEEVKTKSDPMDMLRDPAAMRALLLGYTEEVIESRKQLALAAPKVEFVDRYVDATGLKGFRQVAKLLSIKEPEFRAFLSDHSIMYLLGCEWHAFQNHIDAGRFSERAGVSEATGHAFNTCKFTPKGIAWIAGLIASKRAVDALEHA